jgi:mannosyltransferase
MLQVSDIREDEERAVVMAPHLEEKNEGRPPWAALIALMAVAGTLRAIGLNRDLWLDEVYTLIRTVRQPLWKILTIFPGDNQHMFYSVLARISVVLLGDHPWTLRLPSLIFGVAAVPALYFLGRELTTRREALLAATLLTVSYHHVWFSQNARGYSGMLFWTLLCSIYLLRGLRSAKRSNWVLYAVAAALGTYTYLMMVLVVLAHTAICAWLLLFPSKKEEYRVTNWKLPAMGMALAGVFTLVLYAPVVMQVQQFFSHPSKLQGVSTPAWAFWETLRGLQIGLGSEAAVAAAGALFAAGLWSYWRQSGVVAAMFVLPGLATAAGAVMARGTMYPRFYFYLLGFGVLILIRGTTSLASWLAGKTNPEAARRAITWGTALAALLIVVSAISLLRNYQYPKQDYAGAMRYVYTGRETGEPVVTAGDIGYVYQEYYGQPWEQVESAPQLEAIRSQGRRVWVLYSFPMYIEPELMASIQRGCAAKQVFRGTVGGGDIVVCEVEPDRGTTN